MYSCIMLQSLSKIFLRFTMLFVASCLFLFLASGPLLYGYHSLVIHSPVDRFPGCSQCLAIMNKAAVTILYKSFYGHVLPFLLGKYTGKEGIAGSESNV